MLSSTRAYPGQMSQNLPGFCICEEGLTGLSIYDSILNHWLPQEPDQTGLPL